MFILQYIKVLRFRLPNSAAFVAVLHSIDRSLSSLTAHVLYLLSGYRWPRPQEPYLLDIDRAASLRPNPEARISLPCLVSHSRPYCG
jgi:hypothetical protein